MTSIAYSLGGSTDQTISFTYDQGTDGIGHLTGASDANHSMTFGYDALGEMTGLRQTVGSVTRSITYGYTSGDLTSITTPSGQTVTYGYNANHQITSIAVNGTTVLSNVSYEPFGPANGWTWGNGAASSRSFNGDGLITGISSPGGQETLSYDDASRISGITNSAPGASNWTYGYDALDRLTSAIQGTTRYGWTYDANGNRVTQTGTSASTYTISGSNNQIASISGALARTYSYDAAGKTTAYGTITATYNDRGRLSTVVQGTNTERLVYNALGQRIKTSGGGSGTVLFWYDQAGHLLGEYSSTGALIEETVYLGDIPVATLRPGTPVAIYYVQTDQLYAPRQVTRPSDNLQMWTWFSDPFGLTTPNGNPQGAGTFNYNARLPGQIHDIQAQLKYNGMREYDPQVGRYLESDPMGLKGGLNTYAYAAESPLSRIDPLGLWSVTLGGYLGAGAEFTFGVDGGSFFATGRLGIGLGAGVSYDPDGGVPGGAVPSPQDLGTGIVVSDSAQGAVDLGPAGVGGEVGGFRNYGTHESGVYGGAGGHLTSGGWGISVGGSIGAQLTIYEPPVSNSCE